MVQPQSIVKITDNSGAKVGRVFKVLGGSKKRYAELGAHVIDLLSIMQELDLENVVLVGHSIGATIALLAANPGQVFLQ